MAFIAAPIVGLFLAAGTAATVATAVLGAALSIGASYLANKLLAPKPGERPAGGVELDIRVDADVPQSLLVGRAVTAGSLVYGESYGSENQRHAEVIAIADHPCEGLVKLFIDGQDESWTAVGANQQVDSYVKDGKDYVHFRFWDGSQTAADPYLTGNLSSHPERPWTSAMVGRGVTYLRIRWRHEPDLVPAPQRCRFVVDGIRLYDPRLDTTAGGSGAHRFDDLSTHEFSANLPLIAYNVLRGIRVADSAGVPRHFYGLEATPAAAAPLDVWFAAMNEADTLVDGEPQFHGGAEIPIDTEPLEFLREIAKACDARFVEVGGVYKIYLGAPGLPVLAFDDGIVRADEEDVFRPIRPLEQRINHVTGKYTSPADGWVPKVAPPREFPGGAALDGRRVSGNLDAPMIQSGNHAQRMMQQMLARARKERRHTLPLPPSCWGLEPGDIVEWTSARNGYVDKLFEVEAVDDYHDLSITVSLVEVDETDYDWNAATDLIPEADGSLVTARPEAKVVAGFDASGVLHTADSGAVRAAIQVTWTAPDDADIVGVDVEYRRPSVTDEIATAFSPEPEAGALVIVGGLQPLTGYEVRAKFRSFEGKVTAWSLWMPVTTLDGRIGSLDLLDAAITSAKINDAAVTAAKLADEAVTLAKFAADLSPVRLVSSLPGSGTAGETVYLTTDGKLYVWNGAAWSAEVADAGLADGAVTEAKLADLAVTAAKIAASAITTAKLADDAVDAAKIAAGAVDEPAIAASAVTAAKIAANTITAGQIAAGTITAAEIAALTITASQIAADAITAAKILAGAVTTAKLDALAVTADKIAAGAIATDKLAANAVTAAKIAADTITAGQIAAGAISTAELAAEAVTAAKIAAGTITADLIAANTITLKNLVAADFDNLIQNASFETGSFEPHSTNGPIWVVTDADARSGNYCAAFDSTGQSSLSNLQFNGTQSDADAHVRATEGASFYLEAYARKTVESAVNRVRARLQFRDAAGVNLLNVNSDFVTLSTTWEKISITGTAPADAVSVIGMVVVSNDGNVNTIHVDDSYMRRRFGGELIVDGTITGDKINANTITAANIVAETITTAEIAVGGVDTGNMAVNAVTEVNATAEEVIDMDDLSAGGVASDVVDMVVTLAADEKVLLMINSYGQTGPNNVDAHPGLIQTFVRDATQLDALTAISPITSSEDRSFFPVRIIDDSPAAATYTYTVRVARTGGLGNNFGSYRCKLVAMKAKR